MPGKHKKRLQAGLDPRMYYQTTSVLKAKESEPERALPHADALTVSACSDAPLLVRALLALDAQGAVRLTLLISALAFHPGLDRRLANGAFAGSTGRSEPDVRTGRIHRYRR